MPIKLKLNHRINLRSWRNNTEDGFIRKGLAFYDSAREINHIAFPRLSLNFKPPYHSEELKKKLIAIRFSSLGYKDILNLLGNADLFLEAFSHRYNFNLPSRYISFNFVTEQQSLKRRRIYYNGGRLLIDWDFNIEERKSIIDYAHLLKDSYSECVDYIISDQHSIPYTSCAHLSGSMQMSSNSKKGVVDKNLKMFEFDNVYVCDGSVIPVSGYANTGLTIVALALRLANYLNGKV